MKFDLQRSGLEEKSAQLDGLMRVLRDLDKANDALLDEPEKRAVLPYEGQRTIKPSVWHTR
jgi:hypothetical protein